MRHETVLSAFRLIRKKEVVAVEGETDFVQGAASLHAQSGDAAAARLLI